MGKFSGWPALFTATLLVPATNGAGETTGSVKQLFAPSLNPPCRWLPRAPVALGHGSAWRNRGGASPAEDKAAAQAQRAEAEAALAKLEGEAA